MKKAMKVTSVLCIIFGAHYIIIGLLGLLAAGLASFLSLATLSLVAISGTLGLIISIALIAVLAYLYTASGVFAFKEKRKEALGGAAIAAVIALISLIIALFSKRASVSFSDVWALVLPVIHGFLIIQTVD